MPFPAKVPGAGLGFFFHQGYLAVNIGGQIFIWPERIAGNIQTGSCPFIARWDEDIDGAIKKSFRQGKAALLNTVKAGHRKIPFIFFIQKRRG
ncbi:hypothetical protein DP20_3036 [Shigella flexneri]|nr:hypothetical protein DP20_3036 [Shigella flexneri]